MQIMEEVEVKHITVCYKEVINVLLFRELTYFSLGRIGDNGGQKSVNVHGIQRCVSAWNAVDLLAIQCRHFVPLQVFCVLDVCHPLPSFSSGVGWGWGGVKRGAECENRPGVRR